MDGTPSLTSLIMSVDGRTVFPLVQEHVALEHLGLATSVENVDWGACHLPDICTFLSRLPSLKSLTVGRTSQDYDT